MDVERRLALELADPDRRHREQHPIDGLLLEVARSAQAAEWLALEVGKLAVPDPNDPLMNLIGMDDDGQPVFAEALFGRDHNQDQAPHILWSKLDQERERHARMCKLALDAGVSERVVQMAEAQGHQIVAVVVHVIDALKLPPDLAAAARKAAAEKLRQLAPAPVIDV